MLPPIISHSVLATNMCCFIKPLYDWPRGTSQPHTSKPCLVPPLFQLYYFSDWEGEHCLPAPNPQHRSSLQWHLSQLAVIGFSGVFRRFQACAVHLKVIRLGPRYKLPLTFSTILLSLRIP